MSEAKWCKRHPQRYLPCGICAEEDGRIADLEQQLAAAVRERDEAKDELEKERNLLKIESFCHQQTMGELNQWRERWSSHGNNLASIIATAVEALGSISKKGRVCEHYDTCSHAVCSDSAGAALLAINALAAIRGREGE